MKKIGLVLIVSVILTAGAVLAANVDVILDSLNGSSGMVIKNSAGTGVATFDSSGKALISGNVGIGTTTPESKLDVNGDMKLASTSAPAAAAGKIYFDNSSKRLNYCDGTQWIELDPAYTTKEVKSAINTGTSETINSSTPKTITTGFTPLGDIVVTAMSADLTNVQSSTMKIELLAGDTVKATFYRTSGVGGVVTFFNDFSIPIKVSASNEIKIKVTRQSGVTTITYANPSIQYIEWPY
jgi:hypothetical protein